MKKTIIYKNDTGKRIDKFLKEEIFLNVEKTRGEIIRNIKNGNILVNDKKIKPSHILKKSDNIQIDISRKAVSVKPDKNVKFETIYRDENIIVVDKPAGMLVHPSIKNEENTLAGGLLYKFPEIKNVGDPLAGSGQMNLRPGIMHRLDRDTSGVMIIARNQKAFSELKGKFKNREVLKNYLAITQGIFKEKSGIIDKPIARAKNYKKQTVAGKKTKTKTREAVTEYRVIENFDKYSLVKVSPKTGRTHQIRVHLASIGHPIAGDRLYGSKELRRKNNFSRQMLHAKSIKFDLFGKKYYFEAPIPGDFIEATSHLTKGSEKGRIT